MNAHSFHEAFLIMLANVMNLMYGVFHFFHFI
uniref:Uncharacterized protein n=1 Tax=Arundo donax TaxID=35708 RepID=A0A0A8Y6T8_ARUDO